MANVIRGQGPCTECGPWTSHISITYWIRNCRWGPAISVLKGLLGDPNACLILKRAWVSKPTKKKSESVQNNKANIPGSKDVLFGEINSRNNLHSQNTWLFLLEIREKKQKFKKWTFSGSLQASTEIQNKPIQGSKSSSYRSSRSYILAQDS